MKEGWSGSSEVEHLPRTYKTLESTPSSTPRALWNGLHTDHQRAVLEGQHLCIQICVWRGESSCRGQRLKLSAFPNHTLPQFLRQFLTKPETHQFGQAGGHQFQGPLSLLPPNYGYRRMSPHPSPSREIQKARFGFSYGYRCMLPHLSPSHEIWTVRFGFPYLLSRH